METCKHCDLAECICKEVKVGGKVYIQTQEAKCQFPPFHTFDARAHEKGNEDNAGTIVWKITNIYSEELEFMCDWDKANFEPYATITIVDQR